MTDSFLPLTADIWTKHNSRIPRLLSLLVHLTLLLLALLPWGPRIQPLPAHQIDIALYLPGRLTLPPSVRDGGGGGGRRQPQPPSLGRLPRTADRQMTPPDPEPARNLDPTLIVEQTIVAPQLAALPQLRLFSIGDPEGVPDPPSSGSGECCGIGTGKGHGVGPGNGPGFGEGEGGGNGGGYRIDGGITRPVLVSEVLPEYSEEARKARFEGTVVLDTIVREDGSVQVRRVVRGAGFGLDEQAIAAVLKWRFKPGKKNGNPIPVALNVEVRFNLR
jgi:periplasmic protein TonB